MLWLTLNMGRIAANHQGNVELSGNFTLSGEWSPWIRYSFWLPVFAVMFVSRLQCYDVSTDCNNAAQRLQLLLCNFTIAQHGNNVFVDVFFSKLAKWQVSSFYISAFWLTVLSLLSNGWIPYHIIHAHPCDISSLCTVLIIVIHFQSQCIYLILCGLIKFVFVA